MKTIDEIAQEAIECSGGFGIRCSDLLEIAEKYGVDAMEIHREMVKICEREV